MVDDRGNIRKRCDPQSDIMQCLVSIYLACPYTRDLRFLSYRQVDYPAQGDTMKKYEVCEFSETNYCVLTCGGLFSQTHM